MNYNFEIGDSFRECVSKANNLSFVGHRRVNGRYACVYVYDGHDGEVELIFSGQKLVACGKPEYCR